MQIKLFTIAIGDNGTALDELNRFLTSNKILEVQNQLISNQNGACWCFCVRFIKKMRLYEANLNTGIWTQKEFQQHVVPLIAFSEHANAREFRKKIIKEV